MLIEYLYKNTTPGVLLFLINKLYSYPCQAYQSYIPQLLNICFFKETCAGLETVLLRASIDCHNFALSLHFQLSAFLGDCQESVKLKAGELLECLDMAIVNAAVPKQFSESAPPHFYGLPCNSTDVDAFMRKSIRAEYFSYQIRIIDLMCKISVGLNQIPLEMRDSKLVLWLETVDNTIYDMRKKFKFHPESVKKIFRGPVLSFSFHLSPDSSVYQVVRILYTKSLCFCTKARVPYKMVFETVDISESDQSSDSSPLHSLDEEVCEDLAKVDIEKIEKLVQKGVRFEGYSEFIQKVEKEQGEAPSPRRSSDASTSVLGSIWGESWEDTCTKARKESPFGKYASWKLRGIIVKGLDDLRQEYLAMQLITKIKQIWENALLSLYLCSYEIKVISNYMGFIEYIPNTLSIHSIKKNFPNFSTLEDFYRQNWGHNFEEAQKNYVQSMAGYSLVCYLLNLKDRHNGNILLDSSGHIIHIDFGFFLTTSPGGNMGFESAPFKLTQEMTDVMGGSESDMFQYFKMLLLQGFLEMRKHANALIMVLEAMGNTCILGCLQNYDLALEGFRERLQLNLTDAKCMTYIDDLIYQSLGNWRTSKYDDFQYLTNGIL